MSQETKHSPGPWRWVDHPVYDDKLHDLRGECVLEAQAAYEDAGLNIRSSADKRLIAAAPELLEALEAEHDPYDGLHPFEDGAPVACSVCALIRRVRGTP